MIRIRLKFCLDLKLVSSGIWNGVVGKVFYGEADAGITNIDITYQRLALSSFLLAYELDHFWGLFIWVFNCII